MEGVFYFCCGFDCAAAPIARRYVVAVLAGIGGGVMMKKWFRKIMHRHVWRPLKTEYRYTSYETGRRITVKRCQCRGCGRIDWFHFDGKEILY